MKVGSFLLTVLEKNLNRFLQLDPESAKRLSALEGKTITIEILPLYWIFQLQIQSNYIHCVYPAPDEGDTKISGTPLRLLHVSLTQNKKAFFADNVSLSGNLELGQAIIDIFDQLDIDWEEMLSRLSGDVPAYHVGRMARGLKAFMHKTQTTLCDDINEYLHEEAALFPPREALQDFFHDIDELRLETDRLQARLNRLLA